MTTVAQICNLALAHIKQSQTVVSNLDTDEGNTVAILRLHFDISRQYVLGDHKWNFATKREVLALVDDSTNSRWSHKYLYPTDAISMREIETNDQTQATPYEIQNYNDDSRCILTNQENAVAVYTADIKNPATYSPGFVVSLSWYLASEIAPALSEDSAVQDYCYTIYRNSLIKAKTMDSNEGEGNAEPLAAWDRARTGFGGYGGFDDRNPSR